MQKILHDLMSQTQQLQIDLSTATFPKNIFEPLRLRGGSDDPKNIRSLASCGSSTTPINLDAIVLGGGASDGEGDDDELSIQSENRKADSLSDNPMVNKSDLNNNDQEKNGALDITKQLEKLNKVRESLYSQYGWSSENVNQNSKWDVDMTTTPTEGCQIRDKSMLAGTDQWSNDFCCKNNTTDDPVTFPDSTPSDCWSEADRWTTNNETDVDREEERVTSYGGAISRNIRAQPDDAQVPTATQFASAFNQYRSPDNPYEWNKQFSPPNQNQIQNQIQNQNQSRFPRPITKRNATTPTSPLDVSFPPPSPQLADQPNNSFTAHFQQMNLQDNIMHPYQQRFTTQTQQQQLHQHHQHQQQQQQQQQQHPQHLQQQQHQQQQNHPQQQHQQQHQPPQQQQNHTAQMSPYDFGQNDSFNVQSGLEQSHYPWNMQFDRSTMPLQNVTALNQSFFPNDSALPQNDLHAASGSRWPTTEQFPSTADDTPLADHFSMRSAIDLVDPTAASTNFIPTPAAAAPTNSSTIPNWQHSAFYQNYW